MEIGNLIESAGGILKSIIGGTRSFLLNILSSFNQDSKLILYILLFIISILFSYLIINKFISNTKLLLSKNYIGWFLLMALLIFMLLAFL
jgi:hypothetical protein